MFRRKVKFYPKKFGETEEYAERRKNTNTFADKDLVKASWTW